MKHTLMLLFLLVTSVLSPAYGEEEPAGVLSRHPSPNPNSSSVVFESDIGNPNGPMNLWISQLDGSALHRLTANTGSEMNPAWSPDGRSIAFSSGSSATFDIWTIAPDGSKLVQLTRNSLNNSNPAWSPDGSKIAFVSDRGGTNDIWIMNADGSGQLRLTTLPGQENHPSFSPDGKLIVFSETLGDTAQLMTIDTSGAGTPTPITTSGYKDWNPQWSTLGIVFSSNRDATSEHWKIWSVHPDGTGLSMIGDIIGLDPVWTSDNKILYSDEVGGPTHASSTITLLDPMSGATSVVTGANGYLATICIEECDLDERGQKKIIIPREDDAIKVAILSQAGFAPVTDVDTTTLMFGATGSEPSLIRCEHHFRDLNQDDVADLICLFSFRKSGLKVGVTRAILDFNSVQGSPYEGSEPVKVIKRDRDEHDKDQNDR